MLTTTCPKAELLAAFQSGKLKLDELDQVASHLESCASCQSVLQNGGGSSDALMRELRQAQTGDAFTDESGCLRAIARVEAMASGEATHTRDDTADNAPQAILPMKLLGKYQLLEPIGQGGMGTVYKAVHTLLKRTVAVKVLPANRLKDMQAVNRFRREIEAAGRLDHPHIVRTSDADEADGQHFLVMEWLAGQDLSKYVRQHGPLPVEQACDFIRQAAWGLECAHANGMVHRDVKPSNLFLTSRERERPEVKVLDLGLALLHDNVAVESELTGAGQVMGTYDYIAPEQAMESHAVDARADIYGLGCTFYFLLTGKPPFAGKSEAKKLLCHQLEEPAAISTFRPDVPRAVVAVLAKMMAKNPAQRFGSMGDVVKALPFPPARGARGEGGPRRRRPLVIAASLLLGLVAVIALTFGIIHFMTPEGNYVIETDDPFIKFSVSKGAVVLHDEKTTRTYSVKAVRKANGEYELNVRDIEADLTFNTDSLTIKRGETLRLTAKFVRKQAPVAKGTPVDDTWLKMVAALPAEKQVDAVAAKLKDLNPGFDGKVKREIENGKVTELEFLTERVIDISPVRVLKELRKLTCRGSDWNGQVADLSPLRDIPLTYLDCSHTKVFDLSPLKDMKLVTLQLDATKVSDLSPLKSMMLDYLALGSTPVSDLSPLKDMKLTTLQCVGTKVSELSPLKNMKLVYLHFGDTKVSDLSPLKGMKLTTLNCEATKVTDLSLLKEMPLEDLRCDFKYERDAEILRSIKTLETINGKSAAEVLKAGDPPSLFIGHKGAVEFVAVVAISRRILSASRVDGTVRLWDLQNGTEIQQLETGRVKDNKLHDLAISPDGRHALLADNQKKVGLWNLETGKKERTFDVPADRNVSNLAFSPDGRSLLCCMVSRSGGWCQIWDAKTGDEKHELVIAQFPTGTKPTLTPDGRRLLIGYSGGGLALYDVASGARLCQHTTPPLGQITKVGFSSDAKEAFAMDTSGQVAVFAAETLKELRRYAEPKKWSAQYLGASADGGVALLTNVNGNELHLWHAATQKELHRFDGHTQTISSAAFSPDGRYVVSGGRDFTVRLWQIPSQINEAIKGKPAAEVVKQADEKTPTVGEIRRYLGHQGSVGVVTFSPDGKSFLSASLGELWLWDVDKTTERIRFPDTYAHMFSAVFSHDGERVIASPKTGFVAVWEVKPGEKVRELASFKIPGQVEWLSVPSDRPHVFYTNRSGGRIYDLDKKEELSTRFIGGKASLSKDGRRLLSGDGKTLYLWDVATGKELSNVELPGYLFHLALAPDGRHALASGGNNVYQWDMDKKKEGKRLDGAGRVQSLAISPDGKRALTGGFDKKMRLWDLQTGTELFCFDGHTGPITSVAFAPNGRQALSGSDDKTIRLWQLPSDEVKKVNVEPPKGKAEVGEVRTYLGHSGSVHSVAFAPDGKSFLSGGDAEIFQWDVHSSKEKRQFADAVKSLRTARNRDYMRRVAYSKDGKQAVSGGDDQIVRLWDVDKGQVLKRLEVPKAFPPVAHHVALSPDDKYLLVAPVPSYVRLYVFPALEESAERFGGSEGHFSKDGSKLLTLERNMLQLYHLSPPRRTFVNVTDIHCCALAPDGRYAVAGGLDATVYVWDMVEKKQVHKMTGHKGTIQSLAVSPDGKRALSGAGDHTMRLWDLTTGKELRTFEGHGAPVLSVAFSPDGGQALSAGSTDKSVRLWQLPEPVQSSKEEPKKIDPPRER